MFANRDYEFQVWRLVWNFRPFAHPLELSYMGLPDIKYSTPSVCSRLPLRQPSSQEDMHPAQPPNVVELDHETRRLASAWPKNFSRITLYKIHPHI